MRAGAVRAPAVVCRRLAAVVLPRESTRHEEALLILRLEKLQTELPPPSDPDPEGAAAVQELLGGKFGEMSNWLNYTFQSFNFRARQGARPFYDLLCSIATEEFGHVELVATTIGTMLTDPGEAGDGRAPDTAPAALKDVGNLHHFIAG